ncbi:flagellar hook-length control protein FliK [Falsiroseomonas sp. CW058]|uniref:flagellar hook-length control protein FliK n=1 Tax=Falsiroseomonas sp. CW058 TaxID=3388664 RepID=UPI003D30F9EB
MSDAASDTVAAMPAALPGPSDPAATVPPGLEQAVHAASAPAMRPGPAGTAAAAAPPPAAIAPPAVIPSREGGTTGVDGPPRQAAGAVPDKPSRAPAAIPRAGEAVPTLELRPAGPPDMPASPPAIAAAAPMDARAAPAPLTDALAPAVLDPVPPATAEPPARPSSPDPPAPPPAPPSSPPEVPAAARAATPIPWPARQVAPFVVALALGPDARVTLTLEPAELGQVEVAIERGAAGEAQVRVTAERPETLALLQRDGRELERALHAAGLGERGTQLSFGLSAGSGGDTGREAAQRDAQRQPRGAPAFHAAPVPMPGTGALTPRRGLIDLAV